MATIANLILYSQSDVKAVRKYYQVDEFGIKESVAVLKQWIKQQRHLPKNQKDDFLEHFLLKNKFRIEQTKKKIEGFYTLRGLYKEFFENTDDIAPTKEITSIVILPRLTPNFERVSLLRLEDSDLEVFNFTRTCKLVVLILELASGNDYAIGDKYIIDLKLMSVHLVKKIPIGELTKIFHLILKAYSARIMSIDLINAPSYVNLLLSLMKLVIPEKIFSRIKVYDGHESLSDSVPKSCLPSDYGGELDSLDEIKKKWDEVLDANREWFRKKCDDVADETLRVGDLPETTQFGVEGTFKKLNLD